MRNFVAASYVSLPEYDGSRLSGSRWKVTEVSVACGKAVAVKAVASEQWPVFSKAREVRRDE
jgi:hypothetical protein